MAGTIRILESQLFQKCGRGKKTWYSKISTVLRLTGAYITEEKEEGEYRCICYDDKKAMKRTRKPEKNKKSTRSLI